MGQGQCRLLPQKHAAVLRGFVCICRQAPALGQLGRPLGRSPRRPGLQWRRRLCCCFQLCCRCWCAFFAPALSSLAMCIHILQHLALSVSGPAWYYLSHISKQNSGRRGCCLLSQYSCIWWSRKGDAPSCTVILRPCLRISYAGMRMISSSL